MIDARHVPARLEISEAVSVTERLGWPPAWGKWVADQRPDQKAEWRGGFRNLPREQKRAEPSLAVFGGVVLQGEAKAGKSWRRGAMGHTMGTPGAALSCLMGKTRREAFRPGVEVQTRRARATRPSIVTGATGRGSGTMGLS
jgi:hypothetical protein